MLPRSAASRNAEASLDTQFDNDRSGLCFPSYERIAEAAGCARSTVAEALHALEDAGVLSWVNRIKRVRVRCPSTHAGRRPQPQPLILICEGEEEERPEAVPARACPTFLE